LDPGNKSTEGRYSRSIIIDSGLHHPIFPAGIEPGIEIATNDPSVKNCFEDGYVDFPELSFHRLPKEK